MIAVTLKSGNMGCRAVEYRHGLIQDWALTDTGDFRAINNSPMIK